MPSKSKSQQHLMGMALAFKRGELKNAPSKIRSVAKSMSDQQLRDFAKTKTKKLPEKKANLTKLGVALALIPHKPGSLSP